MKRIRVHSVEQYVKEIGPLLQNGLEMYRADVPEEGLLGVGFVGLNPSIATQLGLSGDAKGAAVTEVVPRSPAAEAGIQARDVIVAVDGQALKDESDLSKALAKHQPGDSVRLTINRRGQQMEVTARLAQASGS